MVETMTPITALTIFIVAALVGIFVALPILMKRGGAKAFANFALERCEKCGKAKEEMTPASVSNCYIRLQVEPGKRVDWDKVPRFSLKCDGCGNEHYFNSSFGQVDFDPVNSDSSVFYK